jgi:hypothetical protein
MSYEITIKSGDSFAKSTDKRVLASMLENSYQMTKVGTAFRFGSAAGPVYFEVDAYLVTPEGDWQADGESTGVNRIDLHIPIVFFEASHGTAIEVAVAIAKGLGWKAYDEQTGEVIHR